MAVDVNESTHVFTNGATSAITQQDGTFTFGDSRYFGGTVKVVAYAPTGIGTATAVETVVLTDKSIDVFAGPLLPYYRNVAFADITVPAPVPPPPAPKIAINLFTINQGGYRAPVNGLVTAPQLEDLTHDTESNFRRCDGAKLQSSRALDALQQLWLDALVT